MAPGLPHSYRLRSLAIAAFILLFLVFADSLQRLQQSAAPLVPTPQPTALPSPVATQGLAAAPTEPTLTPANQRLLPGNLTMVVGPLSSQHAESPARNEFQFRFPPDDFPVAPVASLEQFNAILKPFGYQLVSNTTGGWLEHDGKKILDRVREVFPISLSQDGHDFSMVLNIARKGDFPDLWLVRKDNLQPWPIQVRDCFSIIPVFAGNQLISLQSYNSRAYVNVQADRKTIYTFQRDGSQNQSAMGLYSWQGHWLVESDGKLIMDGQVMNQVWGYDENFNWQLLGGKPFFFYIKDGKTRASYDGQDAGLVYDEVARSLQCDVQSGSNSSWRDDEKAWFYALKDGAWSEVILNTPAGQASGTVNSQPVPQGTAVLPVPHSGASLGVRAWESLSPHGDWRAEFFQTSQAAPGEGNADIYSFRLVIAKTDESARWTVIERITGREGSPLPQQVTWSSDGRHLYLVYPAAAKARCGIFQSDPGSIYKVDLGTGQISNTSPAGVNVPSPDGVWAATALGNTLWLRDLATDRVLSSWKLAVPDDSLVESGALVWSPDSDSFLVTFIQNPCRAGAAGTLIHYTLQGKILILTEADPRQFRTIKWETPDFATLQDVEGTHYTFDVVHKQISIQP